MRYKRRSSTTTQFHHAIVHVVDTLFTGQTHQTAFGQDLLGVALLATPTIDISSIKKVNAELQGVGRVRERYRGREGELVA